MTLQKKINLAVSILTRNTAPILGAVKSRHPHAIRKVRGPDGTIYRSAVHAATENGCTRGNIYKLISERNGFSYVD